MRKCLRCENEMVENLEVMVSNGGYGIDVREKGLFKNAIEKIKCAVCPECGYTETYIENTDKIKQLIKNININVNINEEVKQKNTHLEDNLENNELILVGKIIGEKNFDYEIYGERFYTFDLSVPRLSETIDIIPITISENLLINKQLVDGEKILVKGKFKTHTDERNRYRLVFLAKEIEEYQEDEIINEVQLIGFVCKKPIYRQTPFGREITDLLLAVNREDNQTDYIPAIALGRNAIFCQELKVGTQVKITGRIQSRQYEKKYEDGTSEKRVAYEVSIAYLEVLDRGVTNF